MSRCVPRQSLATPSSSIDQCQGMLLLWQNTDAVKQSAFRLLRLVVIFGFVSFVQLALGSESEGAELLRRFFQHLTSSDFHEVTEELGVID